MSTAPEPRIAAYRMVKVEKLRDELVKRLTLVAGAAPSAGEVAGAAESLSGDQWEELGRLAGLRLRSDGSYVSAETRGMALFYLACRAKEERRLATVGGDPFNGLPR